MEHPIITFKGKQINFWISLSSINLFSTTTCTISVKEWPHLDHWLWIRGQRNLPTPYQPFTSNHCEQELLPTLTVLPNLTVLNLAEPSVRLVWKYMYFQTRRTEGSANMHYGSHFKCQKWSRVIDFFGDVCTLILTYSRKHQRGNYIFPWKLLHIALVTM